MAPRKGNDVTRELRVCAGVSLSSKVRVHNWCVKGSMQGLNLLSLIGVYKNLKEYPSFNFIVSLKHDAVLNYATAAHIFGLQRTFVRNATQVSRFAFMGFFQTT